MKKVDVEKWIVSLSYAVSIFFSSIHLYRVKVIECSAKDDINILECFRTIVSLSRVLHIDGGEDGTSGLKRRSSAYVSATSKGQFLSPSIDNNNNSNNTNRIHKFFIYKEKFVFP